MKCPYQTKVIHKPEYTKGYIKSFAEDITEFCECVKSECPFYYTTEYKPPTRHVKEHCSKAEREDQKW